MKKRLFTRGDTKLKSTPKFSERHYADVLLLLSYLEENNRFVWF